MSEFELVLDQVWAVGEEGGGAEAVETRAAELPTGEETPAAEGQENEPGAKADAEPKADGRNNPDAIRKHLATLKANPETAAVAKAITDRVGKVRGYEEVYPTVREAREVKALIDSVGGREAVTAAVESRATLERVDTRLAAGDPGLVEELFKQSPEGMTKLGGPILDAIAKSNPQAYQAMMVPHAVGMMERDGLPGAINGLIDAFTSDNKAAMKDILGRIVSWYSGLAKGAKPKGEDPDRAAFEKEKTDFATQKEQAAIKETFNANLEYSGSKIDAGLAADVKRLGLGKEAVEALRQNVWREIETRRNADAGYKAGIKTQFNGKTPKAEAAKYLNTFTDNNLKAAIDKVVTTYYGPRKAGAAAAAVKVDPTAPKKAVAGAGARAATPAGALKVAAMPGRNEIDYDDKRTDVFNGVAVRKSDKRLITWR